MLMHTFIKIKDSLDLIDKLSQIKELKELDIPHLIQKILQKI